MDSNILNNRIETSRECKFMSTFNMLILKRWYPYDLIFELVLVIVIGHYYLYKYYAQVGTYLFDRKVCKSEVIQIFVPNGPRCD